MATGDIVYESTPVALANVSRLHSVATGEARAFGEIVGAGEIANDIRLAVPINASANSGTYELFLVESCDGSDWTDGIDPTATTTDVAGKIKDAKRLRSISTIYNATHRTQAQIHITVSMLSNAKYIGFVLLNKSLQTIPSSGAAGHSVTKKVS